MICYYIITLLPHPSQNILSSPADDGCVFNSRVTSLSKLSCTSVRRTQSEREEVPLLPSTTLNWVEASCTVTPEGIVAKRLGYTVEPSLERPAYLHSSQEDMRNKNIASKITVE